jgi:peptidoglycan/LPS O-acetylase OafA/YrhL
MIISFQSKVILFWFSTIIGYFVITFDSYYWIYGESYTPLISAVIYTTCRILWAFCTFWLIMSCVCGYGGLINTILSWKAFVPLARLTYSVYLTHVWWLWIFMGSLRERVDTSRYSMASSLIL